MVEIWDFFLRVRYKIVQPVLVTCECEKKGKKTKKIDALFIECDSKIVYDRLSSKAYKVHQCKAIDHVVDW
jgi:hypothetical protein